jgi:hypothetical protein
MFHVKAHGEPGAIPSTEKYNRYHSMNRKQYYPDRLSYDQDGSLHAEGHWSMR